MRNVTVVTGGLLKLKAQDHIHTSNSFLRQWKTEHPPGSTDWHQDYHGRLGAERSQLWELGWFPELVLEEVCLTCLVLSPTKGRVWPTLSWPASGIYHHDQGAVGGQWGGWAGVKQSRATELAGT